MRKRSEKRTEIIRTVSCGRKIILHVFVQQTAFCRAHRPVLTVVSEVGYRLKGELVFSFDDIFVFHSGHEVAEVFQKVFFAQQSLYFFKISILERASTY